jgi:hypothetical protein
MHVFLLEDDYKRIAAFNDALANDYLTLAMTYEAGIERFKPPYDLILLDHDLLPHHYAAYPGTNLPECTGTGLSFVRWMVKTHPHVVRNHRVLIHSWNPPGAKAMADTLRQAGVKQLIVHPFGEHVVETVRHMAQQPKRRGKRGRRQRTH